MKNNKIFFLTPKSIELKIKLKKDLFDFCLRFLDNATDFNWNGNDLNLDLKNYDITYNNSIISKDLFETKLEDIPYNNDRDVPIIRLQLDDDVIDIWTISYGNMNIVGFRVCSYSSKNFFTKYVMTDFNKFIDSYSSYYPYQLPSELIIKLKSKNRFDRIENIKILGNFYIVTGESKIFNSYLNIGLVHRETLLVYHGFFKHEYNTWKYIVYKLNLNTDYKLSNDFVCPITNKENTLSTVLLTSENCDLNYITGDTKLILIDTNNFKHNILNQLKLNLNNPKNKDKIIQYINVTNK